jgi:hypothetical protein
MTRVVREPTSAPPDQRKASVVPAGHIVARTIKGFCQAYGRSRTRTYQLINEGRLQVVKDGSTTLILEESARTWPSTTHEVAWGKHGRTAADGKSLATKGKRG